MSDFTTINPIYVVSGVSIGFLVGMTGVSGGSLMTPILMLAFGIHPATAVGTDLLYASVTKSAGAFVHGIQDTVDWRIVSRLAAGSVPAAAATLLLLDAAGLAGGGASALISSLVGGTLLLTAATLFFRQAILDTASRRLGHMSPRTAAWLTTVLGAMIGALVSIASVGGGAIGVTVLLLLYPRLPTARIVGTDIAHAVPLTLVAGAAHWWMGDVDGVILASLVCGSLPGIAVGSALSARVPEHVLRPALAVMLIAVGSRLVL